MPIWYFFQNYSVDARKAVDFLFFELLNESQVSILFKFWIRLDKNFATSDVSNQTDPKSILFNISLCSGTLIGYYKRPVWSSQFYIDIKKSASFQTNKPPGRPSLKQLNPHVPDRLTPSRARCAENCGSALSHS